MKKAVIMLSKAFPSYHSRKGQPTNFESKLLSGRKIHTIRANYDWWARKAEQINSGKMYLSVRQWTGKPYFSPQREIKRVYRIGLQKVQIMTPVEEPVPFLWIDGKSQSWETVAAHDGLSAKDFVKWFFGNDKSNIFDGVCIQFTDFRY